MRSRCIRFLRYRKILVAAFLLAFPFFFFAAYVVPESMPFSLRIGNDFSGLYLSYKAYLLSSLAQFRIPWWSPSEACGYPFYSNPFTQTFYPLNAVLLLYMKLTGGYSYTDHQIFTVFGVSLFVLGNYGWLRCLQIAVLPSVAGALTAGLSYRICEILRFPNAVHSAAWYPFILWGMTLVLLRDRKKAGFGLVLTSFVMLVTAGYPYYIYYSIFLVPMYALFLCLPSVREFFLAEKARIRRTLLFLTTPFLVGVLVTSPYLYKIKWLMDQTQDRGGHDLSWARSSFSFVDVIGSWFFPPSSLGEGWYYFGMTALFLVAAYILSFRYTRSSRAEKMVLISVGLWFIFVTAVSFGSASPVFLALWYSMPGFSGLREWSRINILLLPAVALLVALGTSWLTSTLSKPHQADRSGSSAEKIPSLPNLLLLLWAVILVIQIVLLSTKTFNNQWVYCHGSIRNAEVFYILAGAVGSFSIYGLLKARQRRVIPYGTAWLALSGLILINLLDLSYVGNTLWSWPTPVKDAPQFTLSEDIGELNRKSFLVPRTNHYWTISNDSRFNVGIIESWYYNRYTRLHENYWERNRDNRFIYEFKTNVEQSDRTALEMLLGMHSGQKLWFTTSIAHGSPSPFIDDAKQAGGFAHITHYTGDSIELTVKCQAPGYLTFIDNWDPDWRAWIDGKKVPVLLGLGTFKSVAVNSGSHVIRFEYVPFSSEIERFKSGR